jgi:transposase
MPWKECSAVEERLRFIARRLEGESMTDLCREFGISRKTGYKIFDRYKDHGLEALSDRSRRPVRYANQLPSQLETAIVQAKRDKPHWGARKIRELLVRRLPGEVRVPAKSTIHAVLDRNGLVKRQPSRRNRATGTPLSAGTTPNDLWCADFKASSDWATAATAIPSPSQTTPPDISSFAKPLNRRGKTSPQPPSSASSKQGTESGPG